MPGRRNAGAQRVLKQSAAMASGMKVLSEARGLIKNRNMTAQVWQYMEDNPNEEEDILAACSEGHFKFSKMETSCNDNHYYKFKLPKTHCLAWMAYVHQALGASFFKKAGKHNRTAWAKVFAYLLASDLNWRIPIHDRVLFTAWSN